MKYLVFILKNCPKYQNDIVDITLISSHFFNLSSFSNLNSKVIIFIFMAMYQFYLNMTLIEYDSDQFTSFGTFFKNIFFSRFTMLMVDKNQKHFNPYIQYEDFKIKVQNRKSFILYIYIYIYIYIYTDFQKDPNIMCFGR